jgi:hypothetical protein
VNDELRSRIVAESGVFDLPKLHQSVDTYYAEGRGFKEIVLALDLALAARNFKATA